MGPWWGRTTGVARLGGSLRDHGGFVKATSLPKCDRSAHLAGRPKLDDVDRYVRASCEAEGSVPILLRRLRNMGTDPGVVDDALPVQACAYRADSLFPSAEEIADGRTVTERFFAQLDQREQPIVQLVMGWCGHPAIDTFRWIVNWIGNGWLYLFAVIALVSWQGSRGVRPALAGAIGWAIAYAVYLLVKPMLQRPRPRDADASMRLTIEPMDKFSCPSGHCMTATAVAIPLLMAFPQLHLLIYGLGFLIAWSRIACGHHYPSDVLVGIALGIVVSIPVCRMML